MEPGISDDVVLGLVNREGAILLTADKDFDELVFRQRCSTSGVILIRLADISSGCKAEIVVSVLAAHTDEVSRPFTVITPGTIRIRRRQSASEGDTA